MSENIFSKNIFSNLIEIFSEQRRAVPKVFDLRNRIIDLTKKGIVAVLRGDSGSIDSIVRKLFGLWNELGELGIAAPTGNQFDSDTGQEIVEFFFVREFFDVLTGDSEIDIDGSLSRFNNSISGFNVPAQVVLRGMVDGVTELSRMLTKFIVWNEIADRHERIRLRRRYIRIAEAINSLFEEVEMNSIPMVVDAYNNRGFKNSFRSVLNRVRGAIEYQYRLLEQEIVLQQ